MIQLSSSLTGIGSMYGKYHSSSHVIRLKQETMMMKVRATAPFGSKYMEHVTIYITTTEPARGHCLLKTRHKQSRFSNQQKHHVRNCRYRCSLVPCLIMFGKQTDGLKYIAVSLSAYVSGPLYGAKSVAINCDGVEAISTANDLIGRPIVILCQRSRKIKTSKRLPISVHTSNIKITMESSTRDCHLGEHVFYKLDCQTE